MKPLYMAMVYGLLGDCQAKYFPVRQTSVDDRSLLKEARQTDGHPMQEGHDWTDLADLRKVDTK